DVVEGDGRAVAPIDDGYLSEPHRQAAWLKANPEAAHNRLLPNARRPLRASKGHPVTQIWYARQGIITPEMEFIALRENQQAEKAARGAQTPESKAAENPFTPSVLRRFPQRLPEVITAEFVRAEVAA